MTWFQRILVLLSALAVVAVIIGYLGALHPAGDTMAVFRMPLTVLAIIAALGGIRPISRTLWIAIPASVLLVSHGLQHLPSGRIDDNNFVFYQQNLLYKRMNRDRFIAHIRDIRPDAIALQEVSPANLAVMRELADLYPSQHLCKSDWIGNIAVLSRWPVIAGTQICATNGHGLAAMQVQTDVRAIWVASMHLEWPWPFGQPEQVSRLLPELIDLQGAKVVGGDFNAVAWTHSMRQIERASDTRRVGHYATTFKLGQMGYGVGIDHILASENTSVDLSVMPNFGSDHAGLLAKLRLE